MIKGSSNLLIDWKASLPREYDGFDIKLRNSDPAYFSRFTTGTTHATVQRCIAKVAGIVSGLIERDYIVGVTATGNYIAEIVSKSRPEITCLCTYNPEKGSISATAIKTDEGKQLAYQMDPGIGAGSSEVHNTDSTALMLAILPKILEEPEAAMQLTELKPHLTAEAAATGSYKEFVTKRLSCLSDNFYRRTLLKDSDADSQHRIDVNLNADGNAKKLSLLSASSQKIKEILYSSDSYPAFNYFGQGGSSETSGIAIKDGEYDLGVRLTDEQKACMRELPAGHVTSATEKKILDIIRRTFSDAKGAVKNILLEGPPGTGKSQTAIAISNRLGLPYYPFICSDGTNEDSLLGCYYPVVDEGCTENEDIITALSELPGMMEMTLDPEGSYTRITGKEKHGVTMTDISRAVTSRLKALVGSGGIEYEYRPSPLVEAFRNGGVVELQEPSAIMSASVLSCLNDIMNSSDGVINTPIGAIKRHPNCFVIATTNPDSNSGYRKLNEAVRNRFQRTYNIQLPGKAEMTQRVLKNGYLKDRDLAEKLVEAIMVIDDVINEKGIEGTAGMRCLLEWAKDIAAGDTIHESLMSCVINNVTTIKDEQEWLLTAIRDNTDLI